MSRIEARGLACSRGMAMLFRDVSFQVGMGEWLALIDGVPAGYAGAVAENAAQHGITREPHRLCGGLHHQRQQCNHGHDDSSFARRLMCRRSPRSR